MIAPATQRLSDAEIAQALAACSGWQREGDSIAKTFRFTDYHEAMAFVNATVWISHRADHHPDLQVGYRECKVSYTSHSVNGISRNDFLCAAKIDALFTL